MKQKTILKILGFVSFIMALVAVFVLFAPAFSDGVRGSVYQAAFGLVGELKPVVMLCVAIGLLLLGTFTSLLTPFLDEKGTLVLGVISALCVIGAGVLFLMGVNFYNAVRTDITLSVSLGAGSITSAVFAFIAGIGDFVVVYLSRSKAVVE